MQISETYIYKRSPPNQVDIVAHRCTCWYVVYPVLYMYICTSPPFLGLLLPYLVSFGTQQYTALAAQLSNVTIYFLKHAPNPRNYFCPTVYSGIQRMQKPLRQPGDSQGNNYEGLLPHNTAQGALGPERDKLCMILQLCCGFMERAAAMNVFAMFLARTYALNARTIDFMLNTGLQNRLSFLPSFGIGSYTSQFHDLFRASAVTPNSLRNSVILLI